MRSRAHIPLCVAPFAITRRSSAVRWSASLPVSRISRTSRWMHLSQKKWCRAKNRTWSSAQWRVGERNARVRFMLLIYGDEKTLSDEARQSCYVESTNYCHELNEAGKFVATA